MENLLQIGLSNAAAAAVLTILAAVIVRLWRSPYLAHGLWLIVLLRLVAPPLLPISVRIPDWFSRLGVAPGPSEASTVVFSESPLGRAVDRIRDEGHYSTPSTGQPRTVAKSAAHRAGSNASETTVVSPPVASSPPKPVHQNPFSRISIANLIGLVWMAGSVLYLTVIGFRIRRFSRAVRQSRSNVPIALCRDIEDLTHSVRLRRAPRLMVIDAALPPLIWSGWRPTVLVPRPLVESMDPSKRRLVLLHELLHLRRGDHLVRWFVIGVLALYWWNPIAWWAARRLQDAQEECCDAAVLASHPQQSQTYGEALLAVSEFISRGRLPAAAVSIGVDRTSHLKRRMTMILNEPRWAKLSKVQVAAVLIGGAVVLGVTRKTATAQVNVPAAMQPPAPAAHGMPAATVQPRPTSELRSAGRPAGSVPTVIKPGARGVATVTKPPLEPTKRRSFLDDQPLKPAPGDNETQKLLKERYNTALRVLELDDHQYDVNTIRIGNVLEAGRKALDAKLALSKGAKDKLGIYEEYLELATRCWNKAHARLVIGGVTAFTPVDEAEAREAKLNAELIVGELREQLRARQPKSLDPLASESRITAPTTATRPGAFTVKPYWLIAILAAPGPQIDELERLISAVRFLQASYERMQFGSLNVSMSTVLVASQKVLDAELAVEPQDSDVAYEHYLELMQYFETIADARQDVPQSERSQIREARLDAEIKLREQNGKLTHQEPRHPS